MRYFWNAETDKVIAMEVEPEEDLWQEISKAEFDAACHPRDAQQRDEAGQGVVQQMYRCSVCNTTQTIPTSASWPHCPKCGSSAWVLP